MNIIIIYQYITMSNLFNYICSYGDDNTLDVEKMISCAYLFRERYKILSVPTKIYKLCGLLYGIYYTENEDGFCYATVDSYDGFIDGDIKYCENVDGVVIEKYKKGKLSQLILDYYYQEINNFSNGIRHGITATKNFTHIGCRFYNNGKQHGKHYYKSDRELFIGNYKYGKLHKYRINIKDNEYKIKFYNNDVLQFSKSINIKK